MKRIGIITLWQKNYGSALQCYALKSEIEENGYDCEVISEGFPGLSKYMHYAKELMSICMITIRHPAYLKKYMMMRNAVKYSAKSLSEESDFYLNLFCESVLQPRKYSYEHMKNLAREDSYKCFVAGSDQIWSGSQKMSDVFFLKFAPPEKRIAFAPSFGTENIDNYNIRSFRREIRKFKKLSVREQRGQEIIKELTSLDAPRIADPTFLKTREEWDEFAKKSQLPEGKYVLVHFLDDPHDTALQCLKNLSAETGYRTIGFAYPHSVFQSVSNYQFVDGDPRDYVAAIEHAEFVLTDSFHTTLFSVIFNRRFFTFARQYRHNGSQQSRITTLLELVGYPQRFIENEKDFNEALTAVLHSCEDILEKERNKAKQYLEEAIGGIVEEKPENSKNIGEIRLANEANCTGCMACAGACGREAIRIVTTSKGYEVPQIDKERCVKCGRCQAACGAGETCVTTIANKTHPKRAYVAYNHTELRQKAASGGVFAALATVVLMNGGVVFGARLSFEDGNPIVEHVPIYQEKDLPSILQSKYVQSDAASAYRQIKQLLSESKKVLFCGTSCQVDGLYRYLGCDYYPNLFTVDLICHGVPGRKFFTDYIQIIEKKQKAKVEEFRFRLKDSGEILYQETITLSSDNKKELEIPFAKSPYYRLFLGEESYREACYSCQYASINKPADITLGDYFELKRIDPDLYHQLSEEGIGDVNSVIVHTAQGDALLVMARSFITKFPTDLRKLQASHTQLCKPSQFTLEREKIMKIYRNKGFDGIDSYYKRRNLLLYLPISLKRMIKRCI